MITYSSLIKNSFMRTAILSVIFLLTSQTLLLQAETVARCGEGWLELIDGYPVLHLKGSHYEMGYQHGVLLKEHIEENVTHVIKEMKENNSVEIGPLKATAYSTIRTIVEKQRKHVPEKYFEEIRGLASGAQYDLEELEVANFLPELMHCSGFAVMNSATADGTLYHGRVLDYATKWRLQEHAVIIVAEPKGGIPFVNVSYAGFVGSVTGMNLKHVAIGEMGGGGVGYWDGMPMALLVREVLESSRTLDDAILVFRERPRTCEYYYVISDGKSNRAVAMEASWDHFEVTWPGQAIEKLPIPVEDCVLLSEGKRYRELVRRVQESHGKLDAQTAIHLMDRPVAMGTNLHNVLFEPASTRLWVANASISGSPAAEQPYHEFSLSDLLDSQPDKPSPNFSEQKMKLESASAD